MRNFDFLRKYERIIVFDLETTGLEETDDVIELAYLEISKDEKGDFKNIKEVDVFVKTKIKINEKEIKDFKTGEVKGTIASLTGITDERLKAEGITKTAAIKLLKEMFGSKNTLFLAYNSNFDLNFTKRYVGGDFDYDFEKQNQIDVYAIYQHKFGFSSELMPDGQKYGQKLSAAVKYLNVNHINTHRAIDDVYATWEVFKKLVVMLTRKDEDLSKYVNYICGLFEQESKNKLKGITYEKMSFRPLSIKR